MSLTLLEKARASRLRPQTQLRRSVARRVPNRGTNGRRPNVAAAPLAESTRRDTRCEGSELTFDIKVGSE